MNRKGVDFTFSWIFAIIAGAVILFSAIYITSQLIESGNVKRDTLVAGELANILNPIETNLEDNRYSVIEFSFVIINPSANTAENTKKTTIKKTPFLAKTTVPPSLITSPPINALSKMGIYKTIE